MYPKVVLIDRAKFLADEANCFWLIDVYASRLLGIINGDIERFTCLQMQIENNQATDTIDDG